MEPKKCRSSDWLVKGMSKKRLLREKVVAVMSNRKALKRMYGIEMCPWCHGVPEYRNVGDHKQYYACFCSECGNTPVDFNEARFTASGARKIWNSRAKKAAKQNIIDKYIG